MFDVDSTLNRRRYFNIFYSASKKKLTNWYRNIDVDLTSKFWLRPLGNHKTRIVFKKNNPQRWNNRRLTMPWNIIIFVDLKLHTKYYLKLQCQCNIVVCVQYIRLYCIDRKNQCVHTTFFIFNFINVIYFPNINLYSKQCRILCHLRLKTIQISHFEFLSNCRFL